MEKLSEEICGLLSEMRERLGHVVDGVEADCLLFSGGIDTAILGAILSGLGRKVTAVTVTLEGAGEDLGYARLAAAEMGLPHFHLPVTRREAMSAVPEVARILGSFDPALPNDMVVYFGMKYLAAHGARVVMTGDGADEVFGGYDFMVSMGSAEADRYIRRIAPRMSFSSNVIGPALGLGVAQPFISREMVDFALAIPMECRIRSEGKSLFGKWILRKAFEGLLPGGMAWQTKRPLEFGSGMTGLRETIASLVTDEEYARHSYPVRFMNKEHYYYYKAFRETGGAIPSPRAGEKTCPDCGAGMAMDGFHCRICGHVDDWRTA
jgi:asparagine synthase (glutamine-hydrolysing)